MLTRYTPKARRSIRGCQIQTITGCTCCPSRVCLTFSLLCLTRVARTHPRSLHVSSGLPALSLQSQLGLSCVFIQRLRCPSIDLFSHRAHTVTARSPQTMRTSPTLPCLFTPSTSTPTTCLPTSLTLPRILSPVAQRLVQSQVFSHFLTPISLKFYGFLSRSSSHSRSRSNGDIRPSDSGSNESPDFHNATTASTSVTSDSHISAPNHLTSRPRSPSRPLSNNTSTTGETVTPKNMRRLTSSRTIPAHAINDSGIGVDKYHPLMLPPPVPGPSTVPQPTSGKEKRRSKQLFGLAAAPWSRPTTPKDEQVPLPSPPQTPRSRPSKVSKIENWFKLGSLLSHSNP